jgi:hypothetical protein
MKVKEFKNQQIQLNQVKPTLKARASLIGEHEDNNGEFGLQKKKTMIVNLADDDTISEFPDTRSFQENE